MVKRIAYYNGVFDAAERLSVPLEDRGYIFGEGVYEAVIAYNNIFWGLEDHLDRLERSLNLMEMRMPMSREELTSLLYDGISRVEGSVHFVYFQITRGGGPRSHSFQAQKDDCSLMMTISSIEDSQDFINTGFGAITLPDERWLHCDIKTLNLIPNAWAATKAERAGVFAAIFHRDGIVTEGASYNIFMVKDGQVYTAPLSNLILPGVTRKHLVSLLPELGIPLHEEYFTLEQMMQADEVFLASTAHHPGPIVQIDGQPIGNGKVGSISRQIHAAYEGKIAALCGSRR